MALTRRERQARYRDRLKVRLATPSAVALAASKVPDEALDPFTLAVRSRLRGYLRDLGGADALPDTKVAQVQSLVDAEVVLEPMTRDVQALARTGQLWSMKTRRAAALLSDWVRLKEHRDRLLVAVGLEPLEQTGDTLEGIVRDIVAARPAGSVAAKDGSRGVEAREPTPSPSEPAQAPRGPDGGDDARVERAAEQVHRQPEPQVVSPPSLRPEPESGPAIEF